VQCDTEVTADDWVEPYQLENFKIAGFSWSNMTPAMQHLADDPFTRRWIAGFDPRLQPAVPPVIPGTDLHNIVHAADIWFSVKKHWCLEAQRYARARHAPHALRSP